jgi:hypothetical protein
MKNNFLLLFILFVVFCITSKYTFDEKLSLNGDNCNYYNYSKSITTGKGYSNLFTPGEPAGNTFPPGYPLLMSPILLFTDSFIAQFIFGEFFLLGCGLLTFLILVHLKVNRFVALSIAIVVLTNKYHLKYACMMMSELPFIFFSLLTVFMMLKDDLKNHFYKSFYFWTAVVFACFAFHIRTQGVVILISIPIYYLLNKSWSRSFFFLLLAILLCLPWWIRNTTVGLEASTYTQNVFQANTWSPEAGELSLSQLALKAVGTLWKFIDSSIPESIFCFSNANSEDIKGYWILGLIIIAIGFIGAIKLNKINKLLVPLLIINMAIICVTGVKTYVWNRHMISFLVFIQIAFFYGLYYLIKTFIYKKELNGITGGIVAVSLLLLFLFSLNGLHEDSLSEYSDDKQGFLDLCEYVKENYPDTTIFCSRKPETFYTLTDKKAWNYVYSTKPEEVIQDLLKKKIEYIAVDLLPYSSNEKYLYPTIMKYQQVFIPIKSFGNSGTTLAKFNREEALKIK